MSLERLLPGLSARRRHGLILALAAAVRLTAFALTELPRTLERRPELTSPLTSFRSLKEGVFIYEHGTNPYDGGVFYHSPLYLFAFSHLIPASSHILTALTWTLVDLLASQALVRIWRSRMAAGAKERDDLVAGLYLLNPYILLTCLARSTTSVDNALLLGAIASASSGAVIPACALLAFAAHTSLYPLLLLPALVMLLRRTSPAAKAPHPMTALAAFASVFAAVAGSSWLAFDKSWISRTWGVILTVPDLTPNVGMWWYFFTEMFDHFRTFFLGVFQLHIVIYVFPVCLRLKHDPLLAMLLLTGIISTWKSYPTLGDMGLFAGLLGCFPEIVPNLRHPLFTLTVHLYTAILLPLLHSLWLLTGTGNANFFYAATMVYGLNASLAIVDVLGAGIKVDVKRRVEAQLGESEGKTRTSSTAAIEENWKKRGWEVVQFTSWDM